MLVAEGQLRWEDGILINVISNVVGIEKKLKKKNTNIKNKIDKCKSNSFQGGFWLEAKSAYT